MISVDLGLSVLQRPMNSPPVFCEQAATAIPVTAATTNALIPQTPLYQTMPDIKRHLAVYRAAAPTIYRKRDILLSEPARSSPWPSSSILG